MASLGKSSLLSELVTRKIGLIVRFGGDANDDFVVEIAPKTKAGMWDWAAKHRLRTLRSQFRLRHAMTGCYLFSHKVKLPDWGFEQQEVSPSHHPLLPVPEAALGWYPVQRVVGGRIANESKH